jgi:hypothetical protein
MAKTWVRRRNRVCRRARSAYKAFLRFRFDRGDRRAHRRFVYHVMTCEHCSRAIDRALSIA